MEHHLPAQLVREGQAAHQSNAASASFRLSLMDPKSTSAGLRSTVAITG
ncbi:hypothetical protein ACFVRU_51445 [Streptomyces sp. NPDC057927]